MSEPTTSVVVATRDRPSKLGVTLARLLAQENASPHEVIVVDDGSQPPLAAQPPQVRLLRLGGSGRSHARNQGAALARGELLVFVDDDILVERDFLSWHGRAHHEWSRAIVTGAIRLPSHALATPFGRFRQAMEDSTLPRSRGLAPASFCAAGNMSIRRDDFVALDGFDPSLSSAEDQDLALRHVARGGRTAYLPEAIAVHDDDALDVRSYCRRAEWGMRELAPFCRRHADLPENRLRHEVNGPASLRRDGARRWARKLAKGVTASRPVIELLFLLAGVTERWLPESRVPGLVYRLLLGAHLRRGYQQGLQRH